MAKHHSLKGTIPKDVRFNNRESRDRYVSCGPNTYYPELSYQSLNTAKFTALLGRPANQFQFNHSNEYTMVGQTIKHIPQLKNFGTKSVKKVAHDQNAVLDGLTVNQIYHLTMRQNQMNQRFMANYE